MLEMIPMLNYFADLVYDGYAVNKKSQNHTSSCGKGWHDEQKTTHTIQYYPFIAAMYKCTIFPILGKKATVEPAFTFCAFLRYISQR
jgi:hypothetical protein